MLNNVSARQWLSRASGQPQAFNMSLSLTDFRRMVIKVGSSLLVDSDGGRLHDAWLLSLAEDIAKLHRDKRDVLVVSSGAIALGRAVLKLPAGPLKLEDSQAAAAVGQIALARTWSEVLGRHGITAGQVLVTLQDTVERITPAIEAMAGAAGSGLSRGGMQTKIEAGKIATHAGTHMVIASGRVAHPLEAIAGGARCTWFLTPANPVTARKKWIAGSLEPKGVLTIDAGAVAALRSGKSLLPAGVIHVEGIFARGDASVIRGPDGAEVGRGLVAYDAEDAAKIKGRSSADILSILGFSGRAEMVHRDDLVMGRA